MKQKILVVDDDMPMRCLLQSMLSGKYAVTCRENGMEAYGWLSDGNLPDLIISDMMMPLMDGLELLKFVRANGLYSNIPVIILSSLEDSRIKESCLKEGAIAYMKKPFDPDQLLHIISRPLTA